MNQNSSNKFQRKISLDCSRDPTIKIFGSNELIDKRYLFPRVIALNLFEQFHRFSNIWFLFISILELLPYNFSPNANWSTIVPLSVLLSISLLKDLYRSYIFTLKLNKINKKKVSVWNGTNFIDVESRHLNEGMIVMLKAGQSVPADIILAYKFNSNDSIFLDLSGLVGSYSVYEKNTIELLELEMRKADSEIKKISCLSAVIKFSEPTAEYSNFSGTLKLNHYPKAFKLSSKHFLVAGGILKSSGNVIGIVIYCGNDLKLKMNFDKTKRKISMLEKIVNKWVIFNMVIILVLVVISTIGYLTYPHSDNSDSVVFVFAQFLTLYSNFIPISLFVIVDIIRGIQALSYKRLNPGVYFNNEDLNENLGQIEYLITDKSKTITQGKFKLTSFYIDGKRYRKVLEKLSSSSGTEQALNGIDEIQDEMTFEDFSKAIIEEQYNETYHHFARCLCLCNSLVQVNKELIGCQIELALLKAAIKFGYTTDIGIKKDGELEEDINLYFSSSFRNYTRITYLQPSYGRNRKSVIVHDYSDTCGYIYTRGSVRSMMAAISLNELENAQALNEVASIERLGHSAWILAYKEISWENLIQIKKKISKSRKTLLNSHGRINSIFERLENNLKILSVIGINEKLQNEVCETFEFLQAAGIKIWMASSDSNLNTHSTALETQLLNDSPLFVLRYIQNDVIMGKKLEVAIKNFIMEEFEVEPIGAVTSVIASNLRPDIEQEEYNMEEQQFRRLSERLHFQPSFNINPDIEKGLNNKLENEIMPFAVIIDKTSFLTAIKVEKLKKLLICILACAKTVIFTEIEPSEKILIVKILKENLSFNPCVAVVGSGFSDLSMTHESDITIGVLNDEHSLFFHYTDINITTFNQLRNIVIEGHHYYYRMSKLIVLYLYKNSILTLIQFAINIYTGFSGVSAIQGPLLIGFNIFLATIPFFYLGILDKDIISLKIEQKPVLYSQGIFNNLFTWKIFIYYLGLSILQSIIIVLLTYEILPWVLFSNGQCENLSELTSFVFITIVLTIHLQVFYETFAVSFWFFLTFVLSFICLVIFFSIYTYTNLMGDDNYGIGTMIYMSAFSIISILFTSTASIIPGLFLSLYNRVIGVNISDLVNSGTEFTLKTQRLSYFDGRLSNMYKRSVSWSSKIQDEQIIVKKFSLKLTPKYLEKKYVEKYIWIHLKEYKVKTSIALIISLVFVVYSSATGDYESINIIFFLIGVVVMIIILILLFSRNLRKYYREVIITVALISLISRFSLDINMNISNILTYAFFSAVLFLEFNVDWIWSIVLAVLNLIFAFLTLFFIGSSTGNYILLAAEKMVFLISVMICSGIQAYYIEKDKRIQYIILKKIKSEFFKSHNMLSMLLPKFVKNRVKRGVRYIAEAKSDVSVIFCDICEFEKICIDYSPQELIFFLDKLFSRFDILCENHGVIKIETVGKTYMACAGLIDYDKHLPEDIRKIPHANRAIVFSFGILEEVKEILLKNGEGLKVKIGINSGPVTAGVVGYHKPQFSLVGDTVNTASRMCSTLEHYNSIQISIDTFNLIEESNNYEFEKSNVDAKGKGNLDTFILNLGRRSRTASEDYSSLLASRSEITTPLQSTSHSSSQDQMFSKKRSWKDIIRKRGDPGYLKESPSFLSKSRKSNMAEIEFAANIRKKSYKSAMICLVTAFITYILMFMFSFLDYFVSKSYSSPSPIILRMFTMIYLLFLSVFYKRLINSSFKDMLIISCIILMYFCSISNFIFSKSINPDLISLEILFSFLVLCQSTQISIILLIIFSSLQLTLWLIIAFIQSSIIDHIFSFFLLLSITFMHIRSNYSKELVERKNFNYKSTIKSETKENETLLKKMMPKHVLRHLKNELHFTDRLPNVTLLYADIVGFTSWSSNKSPNDIIEMLSKLFTSFDRLCVEFDVYKVCTIGDCYVVMGLSSSGARNEIDECVNVVKMAFRMIEIINEKDKEYSSQLNMRIGIHTGEIIGGVIGTSIVRYDIWGSDVLIANKMESNGLPGYVKISESTKAVLESIPAQWLQFEPSNLVDIKSLGISKQSFFVSCNNNNN